MKDNSPNWDEMVNKMNRTNKKASPADAVGSFILSVAIFTAIGALLLMLINIAFNKAWPNIETFTPAIGYGQAYLLFLTIWCFMSLKAILYSAIQASIIRSSK